MFWKILGMMLACLATGLALPGEPLSTAFRLEVGGKAVPLHRYEDIDYAHFPFQGATTIRITRLDGTGIAAHRIRPERLGYQGEAKGAALTFQLDQPRKLVVNIDRLRKVVIMAEAPQDPPLAVELTGLDGTGQQDNTARIQKAIDELPKNGVLRIPPGRYQTGSLRLKSDMTLYLDHGAILKGSSNPELHTMRGTYLYFLLGENLSNVTLAGPGTIDANGGATRAAWEKKLGQEKVPGRALLFLDSKNVQVRDVTIRDSYSWNVHVVECDDVVIDNVKVLSNLTHGNGDGLDLDGCVNVKVSDCFLYCEDDAISPKASWSHRTPENYQVRDCILWSQCATGIRLGDETDSPAFRDMSFENIDILRANTMLRIYNYDGAELHGIRFRNLWLEEYSMHVQDQGYEETARHRPAHEGVTSLLHVYIRKRGEKSRLGTVRDVRLKNVHSQKLVKSRLSGEARPDGTKGIRQIVFKGFTENGQPLDTLQALQVKLGEDSEGVSVEKE